MRNETGPSAPAVVLGLSKTPSAGDDFLVVKNERKAREVAEFRQAKTRDAKLAQQQASKLEDMFTQMTEGDVEFRGRDRLPEGVREIALPIDSEGGLAGLIVEARKTGDFSDESDEHAAHRDGDD